MPQEAPISKKVEAGMNGYFGGNGVPPPPPTMSNKFDFLIAPPAPNYPQNANSDKNFMNNKKQQKIEKKR